jgi:hypothetical protein
VTVLVIVSAPFGGGFRLRLAVRFQLSAIKAQEPFDNLNFHGQVTSHALTES